MPFDSSSYCSLLSYYFYECSGDSAGFGYDYTNKVRFSYDIQKLHKKFKTRCFGIYKKIKTTGVFRFEGQWENDNEQDTCDNHFEYVKILNQILFPLLVEIQVWIFYIDSITNYILQNSKKYKFIPNLSPEILALKQLRNDKTIVIKKADKGSNVVIMNRDDYIAEVERQINGTKFYENFDENPQEQFRKDME